MKTQRIATLVAAFALSGTAFAAPQAPIQSEDGWKASTVNSVVSRDAVRQQVLAASANGSLKRGEIDTGRAFAGAHSDLTRADVRQEVQAARAAGELPAQGE